MRKRQIRENKCVVLSRLFFFFGIFSALLMDEVLMQRFGGRVRHSVDRFAVARNDVGSHLRPCRAAKFAKQDTRTRWARDDRAIAVP